MASVGQLRIWWMCRMGIPAFHQEVPTVEEGHRLLLALGRYNYLSQNRLLAYPDNIPGGLQEYIEETDEGKTTQAWVEWYSEDGEDVWAWAKTQKENG